MKRLKVAHIKRKKLSFPKDVFPLKGAPIEWWYFTGHLEGKEGKKVKEFGYEFCFFKINPYGIKIGPLPLSFIRKNPFLVFHFSITDKNNKKFYCFEDSGNHKTSNFSWNNLNLGLGDSEMILNSSKNDTSFKVKTKNKVAELELNLAPVKKLVKHFDEGYSVMFNSPEYRTYYLSFTRIKSSGTLKIEDKEYKIKGESWFDHQKMNRPLKSPLEGWDWFGIMFDDKTELMVFDIRGLKNHERKVMGGTYIDKNSKTKNLSPNDFKLNKISSWKNPKTKVTYPSGWNLIIPKLKIDVKIRPVVKSQEMGKTTMTPVSYWEGACEVTGKKGGKKITGKSYVELTGYDRRLLARLTQKFS